MNATTLRAILVPFLLIGFAILLFALAVQVVNPEEYPNSDFFTFWLSGRLVSRGQDPYLTSTWVGGHHQFGATWIPNQTFIYPLPVTYLFVALGRLPLYQAFVIWVFLTEIMMLVSITLLLRMYPQPLARRFILPVLLGLALFRPTLVTLVNGQLSGFLLLAIVGIVYLWEGEKWWQGSIVLPVLILKPNLGVPVVALLSLYLLMKKQIFALLLGGVSGVGILLSGFVLNPHWIREFWQAGNTKLSQIFGFAPTIWGLSSMFCRQRLDCSLVYGAALCLLLLIGFSFLLARQARILSPLLAASIAITITLLMTPTAWPYDQLLLVIPIIAVTMEMAKAGSRFLWAAVLFLTIDVMAFLLLGISAMVQGETWNAILPLSIFGILAWIVYLPENNASTALSLRSGR